MWSQETSRSFILNAHEIYTFLQKSKIPFTKDDLTELESSFLLLYKKCTRNEDPT